MNPDVPGELVETAAFLVVLIEGAVAAEGGYAVEVDVPTLDGREQVVKLGWP